MSVATLDEVRNHAIQHGLAQGISLQLSRRQISPAPNSSFWTHKGPVVGGSIRTSSEPGVFTCACQSRDFQPGTRPATKGCGQQGGNPGQSFVVPNSSLVRAVFGGRRQPRVYIAGYVRPGRWSGELCIQYQSDLVFSTFGGAATALAERLGYLGRRSGTLAFEMEWRPGGRYTLRLSGRWPCCGAKLQLGNSPVT